MQKIRLQIQNQWYDSIFECFSGINPFEKTSIEQKVTLSVLLRLYRKVQTRLQGIDLENRTKKSSFILEYFEAYYLWWLLSDQMDRFEKQSYEYNCICMLLAQLDKKMKRSP